MKTLVLNTLGEEVLDQVNALITDKEVEIVETSDMKNCLTVPANRIGFAGNGGPFNLLQLKVIQEVISLMVFTIIVYFFFKGQPLQWNHFAAFVCLVLAVFFVFLK